MFIANGPGSTVQTYESVAARLRSLVTTPEVLRLINDITTCTVEWEEPAGFDRHRAGPGPAPLPLFHPAFRPPPAGGQRDHLSQPAPGRSRGVPPDPPGAGGPAPVPAAFAPGRPRFCFLPFTAVFSACCSGAWCCTTCPWPPRGKGSPCPSPPIPWRSRWWRAISRAWSGRPAPPSSWTPRTILTSAPCCTPRRICGAARCPASGREEAVIRAWRLFKRLLYYSVEGERLFTGFAILSSDRPLEYYRQRWPSLLWYRRSQLHLPGPGAAGPEAVPPQRRRPQHLPGHLRRPHRGPPETG